MPRVLRNLPRLRRLSPATVLALAFGGLILVGALALWTPIAHPSGRVGFLDALFTSTSAVCVTGLAVVDTGSDFTPAGQFILLLLIQAGGLGVMTFAALLFRVLGRRLSLSSQAAVQDAFFQQDSAGEFRRLFGQILRMTLALEAAGAAVIFLCLVPRLGIPEAFGFAVFHSVSAFCNAGFALSSDSLTGFRGHAVIMGTIMVLVVAGGLGHIVLQELRGLGNRAIHRGGGSPAGSLSFHSRLVLWTTGFFLVAGMVGLLFTGFSGSFTDVLFQSVSARTAGFNTVDIGALPAASLLVLVILMFIGGAPASCAGGIKTTSAAIWGARLLALLRGRDDVTLLGRRIPLDLLRRTSRLIGLAVIWNLAGLLFLLTVGGAQKPPTLSDAMFEQVSAFGTVGLSTGLTANLSTAGRLWIVLTMFVGRLGPLTVAMWAVKSDNGRIRFAEARVMVG